VENLLLEMEKIVNSEVEPPSFSPDQNQGLQSASRFDLKNIEFIVFVGMKGWDKWNPDNPKITKKLVDVRWYTVAEQFALARALREENPDLVHFPHWNICYFWNGPFVVTIHDLILLEYPTRRASTLGAITYWIKYKILFPLILRKAIYKSRKIIVPSNYTKQSILKYFSKVNPEKIEVIYEGAARIKNQELRNKDYEANTIISKIGNWKLEIGNYLLYVGNALPHKNLEFLVRVFKKLKQSFVDSDNSDVLEFLGSRLKLVLVGEPSYFYERLKKYVKSLGLENDIIFTGKISDEELAVLYENARVNVFPSLLEGFGLPPLEAMIAGVPVAAASTSCLPEILGTAALYFDPKNENEATSKIKEILTNQNLRQDLVQKGYEQVKRYDWKNMVEHTLEIYRLIDSLRRG